VAACAPSSACKSHVQAVWLHACSTYGLCSNLCKRLMAFFPAFGTAHTQYGDSVTLVKHHTAGTRLSHLPLAQISLRVFAAYLPVLWLLGMVVSSAHLTFAWHCCRVPEECPQAVADLMAQCMDADPTARPSAKEVVSLLSQPDVVLDHHLPPRKPKDKAKVRCCGFTFAAVLRVGFLISCSSRPPCP
jgi:hypothetical protein